MGLLKELVRRSGHRFDPEVVEAFHRALDIRLAGRRSKGKPSVLVMEPDEEFRRLLKMRLLNEGLAVEEADGYERTLERMLKEPPAVALIDVETDPSEAFQLLQEMQQDEKLVQIPVVFLAKRQDRLMEGLRQNTQSIDETIEAFDEV